MNLLYLCKACIIMEILFGSQLLIDLYEGNKNNDKQFRSNPTLVKQFIKTVNNLKAIVKVTQLYQFKSLNYEKLKGDLKNYSSVRINKQYRLIFKELSSLDQPFEIVILKLEEISKHYE